MNQAPRKRCKWCLPVGVLVFIAIVEVAVRMAGLVDFPTYDADDDIGYIPKAGQTGSFLRTHRWAFNEHSMGTDRAWSPSVHPDLLLIGNSIVMGGNPYDQPEKLGPRLQAELGAGWTVWSIAAGGWSDVNEARYLHRYPEVAQSANFFIWEYMRGGLSALSMWRGDYLFPRRKPTFAIWYLFRRHLWTRIYHSGVTELPPEGDVEPGNLHDFQQAVSSLSKTVGRTRPGIFFLYPKQAEFLMAKQGREWLPERAQIEMLAEENNLVVVDIASRPEWNASLYRSDGTHPTVEGNAVLGKILAEVVVPMLRQ